MSVIEIRNEDELADAGNQLVPVTGQIVSTHQGVVWEMNEDQFAAFASQFSTAHCAAMIREAIQQCLTCFKRGAEWYYAAGRWLAWVKAKKLYEAYGGWEVFCKEECNLSPSQAWKYREFAERFKPEQIISFDGERFSLERALGYEGPATQKKTGLRTAGEKKTGPKATKEKKPSSQAATTKTATKVEQDAAKDEGEKPEGDEQPELEQEEEGQESEKQQEAEKDEPDESAWSYSESTTTAVVLTMPGQFVIKLKDAPSVARLHLDRSQIEKLYYQIEKGLDKDDEYKPDALPE